MADYILHELTHSGDETDVSDASNIDYDEDTTFINDDVVDEEDVDFYRKVNEKLLPGEDVANKRIGRLRIESEEDESSDDGSHDEKGSKIMNRNLNLKTMRSQYLKRSSMFMVLILNNGIITINLKIQFVNLKVINIISKTF